MKTYFLILLFFIHLSSCSLGQSLENKIRANVYLDSLSIDSSRANLSVEVRNNTGHSILLPDELFWGIKNDPIADFIVEIEKKYENEYGSFDIPDNYLPQISDRPLIELKKNNAVKDSCNIASYYSYKFPKGFYRARVIFKASRNNNLEDVFSNWSSFIVK